MALPSMTYLDIVNRAVVESKISLDELTEANFAVPPRTIMYNRFKDWVNDAYRELMHDHPEWFFRQERALVTIYPRIFLKDVTDTISAGDVLVGDISEVELTVVNVYSFEEVEGNGETEVTIEFIATTPSLIPDLVRGETFTRVATLEDTAGIATLVGVGRYSFKDLVPTLEQINPDTIRAHPPTGSTSINYGTLRDNNYPIQVVPYRAWSAEYDLHPWTSGHPNRITQTEQGTYAIYPQPQEAMMLSFSYSRELNLLEDALDVPEALPASQHMYLVWRAVEEFSDFDGNPVLYKRAKKHLTKYEHYLFRDQLPKLTWAPSLFYRY